MTQKNTQQERKTPRAPGDAPLLGMARRLRAAMADAGFDLGRPDPPVPEQGSVVVFDGGPVVESCCGLRVET